MISVITRRVSKDQLSNSGAVRVSGRSARLDVVCVLRVRTPDRTLLVVISICICMGTESMFVRTAACMCHWRSGPVPGVGAADDRPTDRMDYRGRNRSFARSPRTDRVSATSSPARMRACACHRECVGACCTMLRGPMCVRELVCTYISSACQSIWRPSQGRFNNFRNPIVHS